MCLYPGALPKTQRTINITSLPEEYSKYIIITFRLHHIHTSPCVIHHEK